jgi:hypothetical protein
MAKQKGGELKLSLTSKTYCIEMGVKKFRRLLKVDERKWRNPSFIEDLLDNETVPEGIRLNNTEFNGHFGPNFFFTLSGRDSVETIEDKDSAFDKCARMVMNRLDELLKMTLKEIDAR